MRQTYLELDRWTGPRGPSSVAGGAALAVLRVRAIIAATAVVKTSPFRREVLELSRVRPRLEAARFRHPSDAEGLPRHIGAISELSGMR